WAGELGLLGKKATEKRVPQEVFTLRDADLELFLGRIWAGDGFIIGTGTNYIPFYATSSLGLARDVQTLLLRLGIFSGVHAKAFKYRGEERPGFTVHLLGEQSIETFVTRVGPHCFSREEQVERLALRVFQNDRSKLSKDTIPREIRTWIDDERCRVGVSWSELAGTSG